ncbi:efflux RND transporter periplasmic adaptor subunit [Roseiconus lacunae]|uniref:efflux RND transporter periplasmic adaptor subunit n=1 Tax=Roseiconus lacunae TaxID=2605694 RepID=UPI0011F249ED
MMSSGCSRPDNDFVEPPPPTVTTAKPVQQDMTLFYENNGETEATNSAEVRARVRGFIEELMFEPGQVVSEGDPLYRIEPEQYAAAKMQAEAQVESATASISAAKAAKEANAAEVERSENELRRFKKLLESNAGSQSEYDQALAARDAAVAQSRGSDAAIELSQAELSVAKAALAQADLDLNYTTVRAPISGRISRTLIDRGNLADNGSSLASIVDRERIYVYFTIDERTLLELMKQRPEDRRSGPVDWSKVPVYLQRDEADSQWRRGKLEYVDQTGINQQTGTLSLRAVFDNPNDDLLPGMFVTVRLPVNQVKDGVLVPQRAIMGSQQGQFLMVVGSDNRVEQRPVRLGQKLDGWVLVTDGLDKDEQFVVDGIQRARPGAAVDPKLTELSTDDSPILKAAIELKAGSESRPSESKPESETAPVQSPGNGDAEKNTGGQADSPQEVESAS